jgi:hypothetical protein
MISKPGIVSVQNGVVTITGYELGESTWSQDAYRTAVVQAIDHVVMLLEKQRSAFAGQIDVKDAKVSDDVVAVDVLVKGAPVVKPEKPVDAEPGDAGVIG